jgi:hypothetical protein
MGMSNKYYNFNATAQQYLSNAVNAIAMGYYVTWTIIGTGDEAYSVLNLAYPMPNRAIRILFPRRAAPVLDINMLSPDAKAFATKWSIWALAVVTAELEQWMARGTCMELGGVWV